MKKDLHIVVIEDLSADVIRINDELRKSGLLFRYQQVKTKAAFLDELNQGPPDLILATHGLPELDGFSALAIASQTCPSVPFIFVTGSMSEEVAVESLKRGAADYILKSRLGTLLPAVMRALNPVNGWSKGGETEAEIRRLNQKLEQRVMDRTAELEAANRELESFSFSVSHDLRAPVRHIKGFAEMLQKRSGTSLDEKGQLLIQRILESSVKMMQLIDALLSFSQLGRVDLQKKRVNFTELTRSVQAEVMPELGNRKVEWVLGTLPEVQGDPALLRQVLINLFSNAIKFTRQRPITRIDVGSFQEPHEVVFFVRDNGVGFDPRYTTKLFDVFQRLHRAADYEGTGIGLAIVQLIIQRHGGRVWAESELNVGSVFYFSLPYGMKGTV